MPVLTGSAHAHILTKRSRAGFAVIRLELIEPGAATCVYEAKACSPTDQPVRKFKDDLGINMTMKTFFILTYHIMFRVVPASHAKPYAQQQIARDLGVDYENFLTNVRGPPDKYGLLTLGRPCVRCYSTLRALSPVCGSTLRVSHDNMTTKGNTEYIRTWYVHTNFFFIFRLMRYTDVCFFFTLGRSVSA